MNVSTKRAKASLIVVGCSLFGLSGCGDGGSPCHRHFEPYPDLVSGRMRTAENATLLDAMTYYAAGNYAAAATGLAAHIEQHPQQADVGYLYLANCDLALGRPYEAELQLDFLERWPGRTFRDEIDWYNALCLLCSGQDGRALDAARAIAAAPAHRYKQQAAALAADLHP